MTRSAQSDVIAQIDRALTDRGAKREGAEIRFRCPYPDRHHNRDEHPSARWNPDKHVWRCDVCRKGGGYVSLARVLELDLGKGCCVVARYDYVDESGALLFQVERLEPKAFRQRRPNGKGWKYKLDGVRRVLYRLPELLAAPADGFVFVVEGEKDVEALRAIGLMATCNPGGAGKWRDEYNEHLRGRNVVVIPDADLSGRRHADDVVRHLSPMAASVRRPELAGAKDVSEWLAAGHTGQELLALAEKSPARKPSHPARRDEITFTQVGELLAEPNDAFEWLVDGLLLSGGLGVIVGKSKVGKSTLARHLCAAVAEGAPFLGRATCQGPVFYLALEEKRSQVREHFRALGVSSDAPLKIFVGASPEDGLDQLCEALEGQAPVLVAIDPLFRFVRVRDTSDYAAVTAALDPVLALARRSGATIVVTHHAPKSDRADVDAALGSTAITGSVDTQMIVRRTERYRTLATVQRSGEDMPETVIALDLVTRSVRLAGTRQEAELSAMADEILRHLQTLPGSAEESAIHEAVEGRKQTKVAVLRKLLQAGKIERSGRGKRGDPYLYRAAGIPVPNVGGEPGNQKPESATDLSGSQVPPLYREPGNQKAESPDGTSHFSGSGGSPAKGKSGCVREPESEVFEV